MSNKNTTTYYMAEVNEGKNYGPDNVFFYLVHHAYITTKPATYSASNLVFNKYASLQAIADALLKNQCDFDDIYEAHLDGTISSEDRRAISNHGLFLGVSSTGGVFKDIYEDSDDKNESDTCENDDDDEDYTPYDGSDLPDYA